MKRIFQFVFFLAVSIVMTSGTRAQQIADPNFDTKVAHPAYTKNGPKVLFDEAHHNFHTTRGRYKPFADLITNDGYQVTPNLGRRTRAGYCPEGRQRTCCRFGRGGHALSPLAGPNKMQFGMNRPGIDNRQFALNVCIGSPGY